MPPEEVKARKNWFVQVVPAIVDTTPDVVMTRPEADPIVALVVLKSVVVAAVVVLNSIVNRCNVDEPVEIKPALSRRAVVVADVFVDPKVPGVNGYVPPPDAEMVTGLEPMAVKEVNVTPVPAVTEVVATVLRAPVPAPYKSCEEVQVQPPVPPDATKNGVHPAARAPIAKPANTKTDKTMVTTRGNFIERFINTKKNTPFGQCSRMVG